jgi:hypothetical protein
MTAATAQSWPAAQKPFWCRGKSLQARALVRLAGASSRKTLVVSLKHGLATVRPRWAYGDTARAGKRFGAAGERQEAYWLAFHVGSRRSRCVASFWIKLLATAGARRAVERCIVLEEAPLPSGSGAISACPVSSSTRSKEREATSSQNRLYKLQ